MACTRFVIIRTHLLYCQFRVSSFSFSSTSSDIDTRFFFVDNFCVITPLVQPAANERTNEKSGIRNFVILSSRAYYNNVHSVLSGSGTIVIARAHSISSFLSYFVECVAKVDVEKIKSKTYILNSDIYRHSCRLLSDMSLNMNRTNRTKWVYLCGAALSALAASTTVAAM